MTQRNRRQWARAFLSARQQGISKAAIFLFSLEVSHKTGLLGPILVACQIARRRERAPGRDVVRVRQMIRLIAPRALSACWVPWWLSVWPPRVLGLLAVGLSVTFVVARVERSGASAPPPTLLLLEEPSTDWLTRDGGGGVAVPMPSRRLDKQQAPPCAPEPPGEVDINGGCWMGVVRRPPCGQFYEHGGRCYVPVRESPRPPTSVEL